MIGLYTDESVDAIIYHIRIDCIIEQFTIFGMMRHECDQFGKLIEALGIDKTPRDSILGEPTKNRILHCCLLLRYTKRNEIYFRKSSTMTVPSLQHAAIFVPDLFQSISKIPPGAVCCLMGAALGALMFQIRRVSSKDPEARY